RREVLSDSLQRVFSAAVKEQNIRVAGLPRFEAKQSEQSQGQFEFTATFEVYPEISVGDLSGRKIRRPVTEVTDADVTRTIEIVRKQRVKFQTVPRAAALGDQLTIDYRGIADGKAFEGGSAQGQSVVLGEARLLRDFENQLVGLEEGSQKTFELTYPADYH